MTKNSNKSDKGDHSLMIKRETITKASNINSNWLWVNTKQTNYCKPYAVVTSNNIGVDDMVFFLISKMIFIAGYKISRILHIDYISM